MVDCWLEIIGVGEDGLAGLSDASQLALAAAEVIFGGPRHLALVNAGERGRAWSVPFDVTPVLGWRGRQVAVLASGDPFWFGVGGTLAVHLSPDEWRVHPAPSTFSLTAARLGWRLEAVRCLGLHAAPFASALSDLHPGARWVCLLRSGAAAAEFAHWLDAQGFGASALWVLEALGGPRERIRSTTASGFDLSDVASPVAMAVELAGALGLQRSPGLQDAGYAHDGQITKAPVRALTLAALAPRPGAHLWDIGAGSGSVSVEWCLAGGCATAIEPRAARAANVRSNAQRFGVADRLTVVEGAAPEAFAGLPAPQAIFVGGGFDTAWLDLLQAPGHGCRLVVNAVTLETEAALLRLHAVHGGELLRIELAHAAPLGRMRGWVAARPIVQWRVAL
jgi:precorrin-6Y C5,15-methyltransferase (decarboxylating)